MSAKKQDIETTPVEQADAGVKNLGQMLLESSMITQTQLDHAYEQQRTRGGKLSEILVEQRFVNADDLAAMLSIQMSRHHMAMTITFLALDCLLQRIKPMIPPSRSVNMASSPGTGFAPLPPDRGICRASSPSARTR